MRRVLARLLMAVVGISSLVLYGLGAWLAYLMLRIVWASRPSAVSIILVLGVVTGLLGYLNYRFGPRHLLETVEPVYPSQGRVATFADRFERLCSAMDVDRPTVVFTDLEEPNAFAMSSPDGGIVVFDVSLFELLDDDELEAILAHELAHLESHDGLVQLFAFTGLQTVMSVVSLALVPVMLLLMGLAKASAWLRGNPSSWSRSLAWRLRALVLAFVMVVPIVVAFVLLDRSRRREYAADRRAASVTGNPQALARALLTVNEAMTADLRLRGLLPADDEATPPDPLYRLLSTHPAIEERIDRLGRMATR